MFLSLGIFFACFGFLMRRFEGFLKNAWMI